MKKVCFLIAAAILLAVLPAAADSHRTITVEQLPQAARTLLLQHFGNARIGYVEAEHSLLDREYTVRFTDGGSIEFDKHGNWKEIDCKRGYVPQQLVPQAIRDVLDARFDGAGVTAIERDRRGYDIELDNGLELEFDNRFRLIKVDD